MPEDDGYRCWLSDSEQEQLIDHLAETPTRQLAARAMLHGLRSDELRWVRTEQIRELATKEEAYKLRIRDGKTGYREVPISNDLRQQMVMTRNVKSARKSEPLIDATKRTVRRWVSDAGDELAAETGVEEWQWVSPHDLRRTWATSTYYSLTSHYAKDIVMRWGGWVDEETFQQNYLGRETDQMAVDMMDQAGLR
jgi:integrase